MKSGLRRKTGGFTILETIIVLTVTIAILSSTLLLFRGRIPRIQFSKAVNELNTKITDTIEQVSSGHYPAPNSFKCYIDGGVGVGKPKLDISGPNQQGQNKDCIYIGQVIKFGPQNCTAPGGECDQLKIFTAFGDRKASVSGNIIQSPSAEKSRPQIDSSIATQDYTTGFGLSVTKIINITHTTTDVLYGIAYVQSFGSPLSNSPTDTIGSQQVSLVPIRNGLTSGIGVYDATFVSAINSNPNIWNASIYNPPEGVIVCLKSGTTDQYAVLILGEGGNASSVEQQILDKTAWNAKGC